MATASRAIRADRVFDGTQVVDGRSVLIDGGEIIAVGNVDAEATRVIELGGATIMPGFIDLHVHQNEPLSLEGGVTTVRKGCRKAPRQTSSQSTETHGRCTTTSQSRFWS